MLAEIFMLKVEAAVRASQGPAIPRQDIDAARESQIAALAKINP
jgi:hypothetical protein